MTDTRFTTVVDDTEELLNVVDIDGIGDVETLLMFVFARPIGVEEVWNEDRDETSFEVVVQGARRGDRLHLRVPAEHRRPRALLCTDG